MIGIKQLCQLVAFSLSASVAYAQAPNTLAPTHHNQRTNSVNGTWFIVPVDTKKVAQAVGEYPLLSVPRKNKALFPKGFPAGKHPVMVSTGYLNDIRRGNLEIDSLMSAAVLVPYVDRLGDKKTPFIWALSSFIGGTNGQDFMGVVPAAVGSINAFPLQVAKFYPDTAAYASIGSSQYSSQVKKQGVPNPISGPGVTPSAIDLLFSETAQPDFTAQTFKSLVNQPNILQNVQKTCQANILFFNESFTDPIMRKGSVVLYPKVIPTIIAGTYKGLTGYSATGEMLGFDPQDCKAAAATAKKAQKGA